MKRIFGVSRDLTQFTEPKLKIQNIICLMESQRMVIETTKGKVLIFHCDFSQVPIKVTPETEILREDLDIWLHKRL